MSNELNELLDDLKGTILDCLNDEWSSAEDKYEFETYEESEACGDTYVSTGRYITDESNDKFRKDFEFENQPDELMQKLMAYPYFRQTLREIVEEYTKTKELEV